MGQSALTTLLFVREQNSGKKNWHGMEILWKLAMQEEEGILDAQATCALESLVGVLELELAAPMGRVYLERCIENLMKRVCMPQSLELFIKVIGSFLP